MVWIAHLRRLVKQIARFPPCRADTFCAGVSNLAQNNEPARVIVSLAEMRIKKTSSTALRPKRPIANHSCMGRKNEGGSLMERAFRRFRDRFRRRLAAIRASISKMSASLTPPDRAFASQRMCPFCGLITSRAQPSCLECGKSLAPATTR